MSELPLRNLLFRPMDVLAFGSGRPFDQNSAGQARMTSVFPPPGPAMLGAFRVAIASAMGWRGGTWGEGLSVRSADTDEDTALSERLHDLLGGHQSGQGRMALQSSFLARKIDGRWHRLYPLPRSFIYSTAELDKSGQQVFFDRPSLKVLKKTDTGTKASFFEPKEGFSPPDGEIWLTGEKLSALIHKSGENPQLYAANSVFWSTPGDIPDTILSEKDLSGKELSHEDRSQREDGWLWMREERVGIAKVPETHAAQEGMLYQQGFVRLHQDVAIGVCYLDLNGDTRGLIFRPVPLGSEGRWATTGSADVTVYRPDPDEASIYSPKAAVALISDMKIERDMLRPGGVCVVSAADGSAELELTIESLSHGETGLAGGFISGRVGGGIARGSTGNHTVLPPGATVTFDLPSDHYSDFAKLRMTDFCRIEPKESQGSGVFCGQCIAFNR